MFNHSSTERHLCSLQFGAITNKATYEHPRTTNLCIPLTALLPDIHTAKLQRMESVFKGCKCSVKTIHEHSQQAPKGDCPDPGQNVRC